MSTAIIHNRHRSLPKFCSGLPSTYFALVLSILLVPGLALAEDVLDHLIDINVAANTPLEDGLIMWGTKAGVTVMINTETVAGRVTPAVHGRLSARAALSLLLRGSGLSYSEDNKTIKVVAADRLVHSTLRSERSLSHEELNTEDGKTLTSASDEVGENENVTDTTANQQVETRRNLETVVVTAQKRSERALDVPSAVTAISGEDLKALQVNSLADLGYFVPGLNAVPAGVPGASLIIIRGLFDGNSTTGASLSGIYVDNLPVSQASAATSFSQALGVDLNPYDVDRIEVLKGPQGTLYGSNSMGGIIKYVLKQPNLNAFEVTAGSNIESIDHGDTPSWGVRGAVSFPIVTDTLALRVSAFNKHQAGYVDNLFTGEKGFDSYREDGGLATLLWKPNDRINVKASMVLQEITGNGPYVAFNTVTRELAYGNLAVDAPPVLLGSYTNSTRIYSLSLDWNLDFATLSNTAGWTRFNANVLVGQANFGIFCQPQLLGPTYTGCPDYPHANALVANIEAIPKVEKFVEEVRLASPENQRVQWLVGGYFDHETSESQAGLLPYTPQGAPLPARDDISSSLFAGSYKELAGFGDLTYKVTDQFDLGGGGRYTRYTSDTCEPLLTGLLTPGPGSPCGSTPSQDVALWMANARYHLTPDAMLYARAASGYRPGFGCPTCFGAAFGIPGVIKADQTIDYEAGFKGLFLDGRFQVDTDVYHILWHNMQTTRAPTGQQFAYPANAGTATSNGWELAAAYQVTRGLTLADSLSFTHAYLTQDVPALGAKDGDLLPNNPRWSNALRADYKRPLAGRYTWLLGGAYRYRDAYIDGFKSSGAPWSAYNLYAAQNLVDVYTGLATNSATVRLYVTNVFDKFYLQAGAACGDVNGYSCYVPNPPRTIGLSLDYRF